MSSLPGSTVYMRTLSVSGARLKGGACFAGIPEIQLEGLGQGVQPAVHMQLVRQRPGRADASLLLRYPEGQLILSRNERVDAPAGEFVDWRQEGVS